MKTIDPETVKLNAKQAERHKGEKFRQLVESVRLYGFIQNPVIRPNGSVVCGTGRILAWMEARPGEPMPVIVRDGVDGHDLVLTGTENLIRSDYTPAQITELVGELAESGLTQREIATRLVMDETQVSRHRTIQTRGIPALLDAYKAGLDFSKALEGSRLAPDQQLAWLEGALMGLTRDTLLRKIRRKDGSSAASRKPRCKLALPSGTVTVAGEAMGIDGLIEILRMAIEAARRANRDGLDLPTLERVLKTKAEGGIESNQ